MQTFKKDFKNHRMIDNEMSFATGFMTALALIAGILKITGVLQ